MRLVTKHVLFVFVLVVTSVFVSIFNDQAAHAITYYSPEDRNLRYSLEDTPSINVTSISAPIYFEKKPTSDVGLKITNISYGSDRVKVSVDGNTAVNTTTTITIPKGNFKFSSASGLYTTTIKAVMKSSIGQVYRNYIKFSLELIDTSGYIGYAGGYSQFVNKEYVGYKLKYDPIGDYSISMATPCNVTSGTKNDVVFYDLDSGNQDNGYKTLRLIIYDETAKKTVFDESGNNYPYMGQNDTLKINMTFNPGNRYKITLKNMSANNTVRFKLPYDNITYATGCDWSLTGESSVDKITAKPGDTVKWSHAIKLKAGSSATTSNVYSNLGLSGFTNGWETGMSGEWISAGKTSDESSDKTIRTITETYTITQDDVGNKLCQWVQYDPINSSGSRNGRGNKDACVSVPYNWSAGVTSTISKNGGSYSSKTSSNPLIVTPNDTIKFKHTVKVNGYTKTNYAVTGYTSNSGGKTLNGFGTSTFINKGNALGTSNSKETSTLSLDQNYVSDTNVYCQSLKYKATSSSNSGESTSTSSCFKVPYDFTLTPAAPSGVPESLDSGGTISSITSTIKNAGPTKSRSSTKWQLTMYEGDPESAQTNSTAPCGTSSDGDYYGNNYGVSGSNCTSVTRGSGSVSVSGRSITKSGVVIKDLPVGTRVCFVLSVKNYNEGTSNWSHSASTCVVVSKSPKVQVLGGDLLVGTGDSEDSGQVDTSTSAKNSTNKYYGSYAEYAIIAKGLVSGMSSGSGHSSGSSTNTLCSLSKLTLNNSSDTTSCNASDIGNYNKLNLSTNSLVGIFTTNTNSLSSTTLNINSKSSGIYKASSSTINLSSTTISKGKWYVINAPSATVNITGNINYTSSTLNSTSDIPQLIIIAKNINIRDSVTKVDAWLIATNGTNGSINTCSNVSTANINSTTCNNKLTVNGPVVTDKLYLNRTAGAGTGTSAGDPAEVFNLRPDAYLWATNYVSQHSQPTTMLTTELPVRW